MSVSDSNIGSTPLGAGDIIKDSFSIFFHKIIHILVLGFFPALAGLVVSGLFIGWGVTMGLEDQSPAEFDLVSFLISLVLQVGIYAVGIAMLVLLAYDAKQGRSRSIPGYFYPALASAIPISVLAMISTLLMMLGLIAAIVPGIWIYAALSVVVPAVVIDRSGFGGLGRSFSLTKGYRWPIVGVLFVIGVCAILINAAASFVFSALGQAMGAGGFVVLVSIIALSIVSALTYGLTGISTALIYARLRDIKEGTQIGELASVFD